MPSPAQSAADPQPCPGCLSLQTTDFHHVQHAPVSVGIIYDTPAAARQAAVGEIVLNYCQSCQLVWNRVFDLAQVPFRPGYEVGLNHSAKFRDFLQQVASRLIERYQLAGKTVLEIGCGAGYFLRLLCGQGKCHGVGIDPTVPEPGEVSDGGLQIRFIQDYFSEKYAHVPCDFVCCLSVFEAVPRPLALLQNLRGLLAGREKLDVYFEVFNAHRAFEALETFSPHYEQCNYFGVASLANIFLRAGFEVLEQGTCYGAGQYAYVEARLGPQAKTTPLPTPAAEEVPPLIANFTRAHQEQLQLWKSRLEQFRAERTRVVLWGSGGKGISFLNELQIHQEIEFVVDINKDRQTHYMPVTAQQIVAPEFLLAYQPEVVVVTNPLYEQEIRSQCDALGIQTRFVPL